MKIGHKLTIGFIGLAMLIATIGYVTLREGQNALEKSIGEHSATFATQVLNDIYISIHSRAEAIQAYATDELARKYITLSNTRFENMPDPSGYITKIDQDWVNGADVTGVMDELTVNELAKEIQSKRSFYQNKYGYPLFAEIFITNKFGANIAQTNKTTDYYQADEEWWQLAKQNGLYVSDVKYEESSETFSSDIAVRIDDENGNFLGVIKAVLNVKETMNIINEAKLAAGYGTTQLHLVNKDGQVIYSTKGYGFHKNIKNELASRFGDYNQPEHKYYVVSQQKGEKGLLFAHAYSTKHKDLAELGWILFTETETSEIFAPITDLRNTMLLVGMVIMGLTLLASSVTYRSIVIPIAELKKATVQIASGNLDTNLTTPASDEIGQLANSFQRMAAQLKKTISDLNDEVNGRKMTEEKLRDNQQFLNSIFDSIQDGIVVLDKDLNIVKVNGWKEKFHADVMPLVGKKCFEAFHQWHEACPSCPSVHALNTGKQYTKTVSGIRADNQTRCLEITAFPLKNADGKAVGVIEHVKDVTEQKKAEAVITEKTEQMIHRHNTLLKLANMPEQNFDSLLRTTTEQDAEALNVAQVGVWFFNEERTRIICRDLFITTKKVHENGESLEVLDYPRYFTALENSRIVATTNALNDLRTCEFADTYLKPKGVTSMMDVPVRLHGRIVGIICHEHTGPPREWTSTEQDFAASVADMISLKLEATDRQKAEQALEKLNKDLEAAVQELSRSNRQLHDFVHIAAHDLKTPVRGIGTLADWITADYSDKFDHQGREQLRLLKVRVNRIDKLIDGMLQFSKIVRTRQNERQINLNALLTQLISDIKTPGNIEIAVDSLPGITGESEHISQIFRNLLLNAVAFMDKPKGLIKVGCVEQGDFWKFYVSDNGPGIEQRHFDRIFKIFQTLHSKEEPETAGIGLTIARKTVELYGGKIWVESRHGSGSTFFFTLPKQQEEPVYADNKTDNAY